MATLSQMAWNTHASVETLEQTHPSFLLCDTDDIRRQKSTDKNHKSVTYLFICHLVRCFPYWLQAVNGWQELVLRKIFPQDDNYVAIDWNIYGVIERRPSITKWRMTRVTFGLGLHCLAMQRLVGLCTLRRAGVWVSYFVCRKYVNPWRKGPFFHPPAGCSGLWNCAPWSPYGSSPGGR